MIPFLTTVFIGAQGDESPMNLDLFQQRRAATSRFYSPKCVEQEFSEVYLQDPE
jgi:hypothetical protein